MSEPMRYHYDPEPADFTEHDAFWQQVRERGAILRLSSGETVGLALPIGATEGDDECEFTISVLPDPEWRP